MNIAIYPINTRSVTAGNIHTWASDNECDFVIELHLNSANDPTAHGYETLKHTGSPILPLTQAIHNSMVALGWRDRGIKSRGNLGNMNLMKNKGISYILLEFCFIKNANDMTIWNNSINTIPTRIINACKESGIKKLGIVYGHGGNDVGALGLKGEKEAIEVRRLKFNTSNSNPTTPKPTGNPIGEIEVATNVPSLNVRSAPIVSSGNILGTVTGGFKTPTYKKIGEWYEIAYQNVAGYVHEDYVSFISFEVSTEPSSAENMAKLFPWQIEMGEQALDSLKSFIVSDPQSWKKKLGDTVPNWLMFGILGRVVENYIPKK